MIALLDMDIFAFRSACTVPDPNEFWIAKARLKESIERTLNEVKATEYIGFLSGDASTNFRYRIYPEYKANRKDQIRPVHLEPLKEYLVKEWSAKVTEGYEADDGIGIALTSHPDAIVCSIDKDLLQLPGKHWNFVKDQYSEVTEWEGLQRFYAHILQGDASDNIKGVKGIGRVKSWKAIVGCKDEGDLLRTCLNRFQLEETNFIQTASLIYVLRKEKEHWITKPVVKKLIAPEVLRRLEVLLSGSSQLETE
jgi:5'-3' exonuclease